MRFALHRLARQRLAKYGWVALGALAGGRAWAAGEGDAPVVFGATLLGLLAGVAITLALRARGAHRERAALRRALAACADWWWRADAQMRVTDAESGRRVAPGVDLTALRGRPPWQLDAHGAGVMPPDLAAALAARLPFYDIELPAACEGEPDRAVCVSGAPLFSGSGRFAGWAGVASLVAGGAPAGGGDAGLRERVHQLEADAVRRAQRHELAVKELDSFAHSVSHDLRAPLRVIDGFAHIVLEDYGEKLEALGREHLKRIVAAGARMNSMIDTLLSMSRMTGRDLQYERVDLSETAQQLVEELRSEDPGRDAEFVIEPALAIEGDRTLLRMVLQNLLGNAFKFSSRTPGARIEFGRAADAARAFFVRDNGAGFDMRFADRLFGVFQRLHSQSEFAGTGVGLATVQRIVRRHGGRIWAQSEPGKGATFYFTLWESAGPNGA